MENIDPLYFLTPLVVISFSFGLAAYWRTKRRLTLFVLLFSSFAYFGAIFAKYVIQSLTYAPFQTAVGTNPVALGAYFGLQTTFLEVGGAYLVANYAVSRGTIGANDAEGYGISLSLWENGVLLGAPLLLNYAFYYVTLSSGSEGASQLFAALNQAAPTLFDPPSTALPLIGYATLERFSSLLLHFSWGYLCVLAAALKRRRLLLLAMPMGLADFFVPLAGAMGTAAFEGLLLAVGLASLVVALGSTRGIRQAARPDLSSPPAPLGSANIRSIFYTNIRRAFNFGRVYLAIGILLPLLLVAELSAASSTSASSAASRIVGELYPLLLPVFVLIGSTGALMIFASDKDKGVFEYLLAYGVDVPTIFWSTIVSALALVTVVLGASLTVTVVALSVTNAGALSVTFAELVLLYTIPLSYAATSFMSMAGMLWSQLTTRRAGVNSPLGVAPLLGVAPVMAVLLLALGPGAGMILTVVGAASMAMVWGVVIMAWVANSRMQRERFLSSG